MEAPAKSQFYGQIRKGRISSVNKDKHTARVEFFDGDGWVSFDFPVLGTVAGDYALPVKGTPVLCLIEDGAHGDGYVLGSIYTGDDPPPLDDAGKRSIASDDLRLGDPDAEDKVALAPKVKEELDKIKTELDNIKTGLQTHTHPYVDTPAGSATTSPPAVPPYTVGYSPTEPAAENVSAK